MIYGSVCSGIEAASVAWESLGWKPAWFSEIKKFPSAVLQAHWPNTPNLGDMTQLCENDIFKNTHIDLLVGGTPCQSFSLAGDRCGLEDPRGNLALEFIKILKEKQPRWFVWENVPGVLSLNQGQDFSFIRSEIRAAGYEYVCRIFNSADFGLQQNRPRVFVVGYFGDGRPLEELLRFRFACYNNSSRSVDEARGIPTLTLRNAGAKNARGAAIVETIMREDRSDGPYEEGQERQVRACTPGEEEKRQGFSGSHTLIPWTNNLDSERYEAIGNSMAVPVMRWIGETIQKVEDSLRTTKEKCCNKCGESYKRDTGYKHKEGRCLSAPALKTAQSSAQWWEKAVDDETERRIAINREKIREQVIQEFKQGV